MVVRSIWEGSIRAAWPDRVVVDSEHLLAIYLAQGTRFKRAETRLPMKVILTPEAEAEWLDHDESDTGPVRELLVPCPPDDIEVYEISNLVNSPKNDVPDVIARVG